MATTQKPKRLYGRGPGTCLYPDLSIKMRPTSDLYNVLIAVDELIRTQPNGGAVAAEFVVRVWTVEDYQTFREIVAEYVKVN